MVTSYEMSKIDVVSAVETVARYINDNADTPD